MDLSPVTQAGVPFAIGVVLVLVGLLCSGRVRAAVAGTGALVALGSLVVAAAYAGLGVATQAWDTHPTETGATLACLTALTATTISARPHRRRPRRDDDGTDDDGGLGVGSPPSPEPRTPTPAPAPTGGPALDWADFDDRRRSWEREPAGV